MYWFVVDVFFIDDCLLILVGCLIGLLLVFNWLYFVFWRFCLWDGMWNLWLVCCNRLWFVVVFFWFCCVLCCCCVWCVGVVLVFCCDLVWLLLWWLVGCVYGVVVCCGFKFCFMYSVWLGFGICWLFWCGFWLNGWCVCCWVLCDVFLFLFYNVFGYLLLVFYVVRKLSSVWLNLLVYLMFEMCVVLNLMCSVLGIVVVSVWFWLGGVDMFFVLVMMSIGNVMFFIFLCRLVVFSVL